LTPENVRAGGEFAFNPEVDRILLGGIHLGRDGQLKALRQVQHLMPSLGIEAIDARMQRIAAAGIPTWLKADEFWTAEMDNVLRKGIQQGRIGERNAVAKILRLCPGLRTAVVWRRLHRLRQRRAHPDHRASPFAWTEAFDTALLRAAKVGGFEPAVAEVQRLTGFPREAVMRRARKLGLCTSHSSASTPWTDADVRFLLESVQHLSVKVIARELHRSEKAVWRKVGDLGLDLFDLETVEWLLEFGVAAPAGKARAVGQGD
jgi:hypothetical protein